MPGLVDVFDVANAFREGCAQIGTHAEAIRRLNSSWKWGERWPRSYQLRPLSSACIQRRRPCICAASPPALIICHATGPAPARAGRGGRRRCLGRNALIDHRACLRHHRPDRWRREFDATVNCLLDRITASSPGPRAPCAVPAHVLRNESLDLHPATFLSRSTVSADHRSRPNQVLIGGRRLRSVVDHGA